MKKFYVIWVRRKASLVIKQSTNRIAVDGLIESNLGACNSRLFARLWFGGRVSRRLFKLTPAAAQGFAPPHHLKLALHPQLFEVQLPTEFLAVLACPSFFHITDSADNDVTVSVASQYVQLQRNRGQCTTVGPIGFCRSRCSILGQPRLCISAIRAQRFRPQRHQRTQLYLILQLRRQSKRSMLTSSVAPQIWQEGHLGCSHWSF